MSVRVARGVTQLLTHVKLLFVQVLFALAPWSVSFISSDDIVDFMQRLPMALLMVFLFARICAQWNLGANERRASACEASLGADTVPFFVAKDVVALLEVLSLGLGFALVFGQVSGGVRTSFGEWFSVGVAFVYGIRRPLLRQGLDTVHPRIIKLVAVASLMLWFTVAATGRWIGFSG